MFMSVSLMLACGWCILANVIGMFPSKHKHWPAFYVLLALGLPLLAYVYVENGIWITLVVVLAAASIFRWPVRYLFRWIKRVLRFETAG